jgi:DNA polymerase (family 10)
VRRAAVVGSLRRRRETVGGIDLLAASEAPGELLDRLARAGALLERGPASVAIRLASGMRVDLRVAPEASFGVALHRYTGTAEHVRAVRDLARRRGTPIEDGARLPSEEDVFARAGLPAIPPELREASGEIEAATRGGLPRLLDPAEIRGDVHLHPTATDGTATIEEMAEAAAARGLGYVAITDHSRALAMARGLDEEGLRRHAAAVRAADRGLGGRIRIFTGVEVDILRDGALDLARDCLAEVDVVIGSVHSHFQLPPAEMTARLVRAIESGSIDVLGHPTGRILLRRDPYPYDVERVLASAASHGVALESSATPDRLDLSAEHCRLAKRLGVKLVVSTDAHAPSHLDFMRFGVANARRGWIEAQDVVNTREADDFLWLLHDGHRT